MISHDSLIRKRVIMALFVSIALVLSYFERAIPLTYIMPGLKLGLANIITLMGLILFGWVDVLVIVIVRVLMTSMFTGSVMSFFYSMAGGLLSLISMKLLLKFGGKHFSLVGVSVLGASAHNTGQMLVLSLVTGSLRIGLQWLPYLLVAGVITGTCLGFIVLNFYRHWQNIAPYK